jgi:hypothetical protein
MTGFLSFITDFYEALPDHLNLTRIETTHTMAIQRLEVEADELWSVVGDKGNKCWVWLAMEVTTPVKSSPFMSVIAAETVPKPGGINYPDDSNNTPSSLPICTRAMSVSFRPINRRLSPRLLEKPILSSDLIVLCAIESHVWLERHYRFLKSLKSTSASSNISSVTIISQERQHYLFSTTGMGNRKSKCPASRLSRRHFTTSPLAKLTRPHLNHTISRPRQYNLLDVSANRPVTWVTSSPGSGKTTLVSDYLEIKKIGGIWYPVEFGDSDVASFFYYLTLAVPLKSPKPNRCLPLLTPEYLPDLEGFTRRFFREFYTHVGSDNIIVLDNYQNAEIESALHKVVVWALSEIPPGIRLIIISRTVPPAEYAHCIANSLINLIGWKEMRLTLDETKSLVTDRLPTSPELISELHEVSAGWAAGWVSC